MRLRDVVSLLPFLSVGIGVLIVLVWAAGVAT